MGPSKPETSTGIVVRLARPGVDPEEYHLPGGATLADLLRASGVSTLDQTVLVGGLPLEEALTLSDGVVVSVEPRPEVDSGDQPWQMPKLVIHDEATFDEFLTIMRERRRREYPEEEEAAEGSSSTPMR